MSRRATRVKRGPVGSAFNEDVAALEQTVGLIASLLAGLLALWISLTVLGLIGLTDYGGAILPTSSLRITVAFELALCFSTVVSPLTLPWLIVFALVYSSTPSQSFLWKWWVCTPLGILAGVLALWVDAVVYSLFAAGNWSTLNLPLLYVASIPAAAAGGAICSTAAMAAKWQHGQLKADRPGVC